MGPTLDIYVLTRHRNRDTIDRFLETYVDRAASEDRGDEELMMIPLVERAGQIGLDAFDWEPAFSLSHAITRGLDYPRRAFCIYLKASLPEIHRAALAFTTDDQMILGLALLDDGSRDDREAEARVLLARLAALSDGHRGLIAVDQYPPLNEEAFARGDGVTIPLYSWQRA